MFPPVGNPAKKRADEAKARRLRVKQEKEAKELRKRNEVERLQREALATVVGDVGNVGGENDTMIDDATTTVVAHHYSSPVTHSESTELTAAQKAAEQRKRRSEFRAQVSAATSIQSIVRCKLVATKTREEQRAIFDKRMADLVTLSNILTKQSTTSNDNAITYVPPPATVSMMTSQFMFFACPTIIRKHQISGNVAFDSRSMVMEGRDLSRWAKLATNILLPGVTNENLDLDPLLPWMESSSGRRRLLKVLELCITSISMKERAVTQQWNGLAKNFTRTTGESDTNKCYSTVECLLRTILRLDGRIYSGEARDAVSQMFYSILMQPTCNGDSPVSDIISSLRALLLYGPTRANPPIPVDAGRLREHCVTDDEKERASLLLKLTIDLIASSTTTDQLSLNCLCSRFITEVLTVPLLTWKVSSASYARLIFVDPNKGGAALVNFIHRFINLNAETIYVRRIESVLNRSDISLTSCPAPAVLCLLANLLQVGKTCEAINGMNPTVLHYTGAAEYFNFLALLIDSAPLGTFSSRMSAVEWVTIGSSSTPIILSDVLIEQAAAILADSYVRALYSCAINDNELNTMKQINTITERDEKHEKELEDIGTSSAASVAAKEAMADRNRNFWQTSKWGMKLQSLLNGSQRNLPKSSGTHTGVGKLMNTSAISRQLANGNRSVTNTMVPAQETLRRDADTDSNNAKKPQHEYSVLFLLALCRTYGTIIARWGGSGRDDLVRRDRRSFDSAKSGKENASSNLEPCVTALLNVLCFSTNIVVSSWAIVQSNPRVVSDLYTVIDVKKGSTPIRAIDVLPTYKRMQHSHYGACDGNVGAAVLLVFITCMSHTLIVTEDVEIHDMGKPLPKHQLRRCILLLKKLLYRGCCLDDVHEATKIGHNLNSTPCGLALIAASAKLQTDLYNRSSRRLLCAPKLWIEDGLLEQELRRCKSHNDYTMLLSTPVCRLCPFLISFKRRLVLFERLVTSSRTELQGSNEERNLKPGIMVKVMRGRVLEDGLASLNKLGRDMRQRIVVSYLSEAGMRETGIDVGGLFKEFWSDLSNIAFDVNYALFKNTDGNLMYPNPSSKFVHGTDHVVLFEFLGRILGKALYENITIQPQFAHLFLSFLRGDHTYLHLLTDLSTIDPQLYGNLMFLKSYDGDVSDLCLTFTVANDDFGVSEVPLVANGENIEVTNENKRRYVYLVAKHHVSDRIKEQSDAFCKGLWDVIERPWLRLFNEPELQVLISGASDGKIDVSDMKSNTRYTGGYTMVDRNIIRFWSVVNTFTPKNQADLLRFVTSCERPPPLGFASMNPPFTIQRVGIMTDAEKLPTASTCFNTLKLPTYSSERVLKEKLMYAIESGAGFELT